MRRSSKTQNRPRAANRGTVMIYAAILMTVLVGMVALAFDVGRMELAKQRAQQVCDAAAQAGAWYLTGEQSSTVVDSTSGIPTASDGNAAKAAKYAALANNEASPAWATSVANLNQPGATVSFPPYPAMSGYVTSNSGAQIPVKIGEAIKVEAVIHVPMTVAGIFGIHEAAVYAQSIAVVGLTPRTPTPVTVTGSPLPFAVADTTIWDKSATPPTVKIQMGDQVTLKLADANDPAGFIGPGNFLAVAYPGDKGGSDYRARIAGSGPPVTFILNQPITLLTEPGNMTGPTEQGLTQRLGSDVYPYPAANATAWSNWLGSYNPNTGNRTDTKRIGLVPIVADPGGSLHGRKSLPLVGFAGFFIEGFETFTVGNNTYIRLVGRFVGGIYTADGITWLDPNVSPPYSSTVTRVRLVR